MHLFYLPRVVGVAFCLLFEINGIAAAHSGYTGAQIADGIPSDWKINGVDYTSSDGTKHHLDLKALGASPQHSDVIVWVDWMDASDDPAPHASHMPLPSAISAAKNAFSAAHPDGTDGINLIVLVSPDPVPHKTLLGTGSEASIWADFDAIKQAHFPKELAGVVHYCLFAHDINTSQKGTSGDSRGIGAYDFIVSLGSWEDGVGNEDEQTGTFLHELGHNLGLQHGGNDPIRWKPNYLSVMNYAFQTDGLRVPPGKARFDYSWIALRDLNESDLDETQPLTQDSRLVGWSTVYFCPGASLVVDPPVDVEAKIDWNCDQQFTDHIASHISGPSGSPTDTVLKGFDDWANLTLIPQASTAGLAPRIPFSVANELTLGEANQITIPAVQKLTAVASNGRVRLSWESLPQSRVVGYRVTRIDKDGTTSQFTTEQSSFVDKDASPGVRYDVHGLYVPHGFAALMQVHNDQTQELTIAGEKMDALSMQAIDSNGLSKLKEQSKSILGAVTKNWASEDVESVDSAVKVQKAKVILATKGVSVELKGVN